MDLHEFIATSLKQIIDGVRDAQEYGRGKGAFVNKHALSYHHADGKVANTPARPEVEQPIEFDVAVTVSESHEKGAKGGIQLSVFSANLGGTGATANETVSRIRFKIGVVFPGT